MATRPNTRKKAPRNGSATKNGKPKKKGQRKMDTAKVQILQGDLEISRSDAANLRQKLREQSQINRQLRDANNRLQHDDSALAAELDRLHKFFEQEHAETEKLLRELDGAVNSGS